MLKSNEINPIKQQRRNSCHYPQQWNNHCSLTISRAMLVWSKRLKLLLGFIIKYMLHVSHWIGM